MSLVSTYDVVDMVVEEASSQFGERWGVLASKRESLRTNCTLIDRLVSEFYCESVEAEVDDETMKLTISIVCPDMILEYGRTHPFFTLIQSTESFSFSTTKESLMINFVFAGLWEKKD